MGISQKIKQNPKLKKLVHNLLIPPREARPRKWVSWFLNPFFHKKGNKAVIRSSTRLDVLPFNPFELGAESIIEDFSTINNGLGGVIIGERSLIGISNVIIGPVTIGNAVILAQNVVMSAINHGYENIDLPIRDQPCSASAITVEDEVWIGANVVITAGVCIGKHSVVAGGSVVTKDVPPYSVVGGNPAKILKAFNFSKGQWERVSYAQKEFLKS